MASPVLIDTGPLVAIINRRDQWHEWARQEFSRHTEPFLTCDAVLSEAFHLLEGIPGAPLRLVAMLDRGVVFCKFSLAEEWPSVAVLMRKYADLPMALADACLVRMAETHPGSRVCTLDRDFVTYRKGNRQVVPLIRPGG